VHIVGLVDGMKSKKGINLVRGGVTSSQIKKVFVAWEFIHTDLVIPVEVHLSIILFKKSVTGLHRTLLS